MPIEWEDGAELHWINGKPVLWQSEPIPGPGETPFPQEPRNSFPARIYRRAVFDLDPGPSLPASSPYAPPLSGAYRIEVRDRSTGLINPGCRFIEGVIDAEFSHVLDDVSEANITVSSPDDNEGCVGCVPTEWEDELVFYRDSDPEPVWIGSIIGVTDGATELVIRAVSRAANFGDRRAAVDHPALPVDAPTVDPAELVEWLLDQAESEGPLGLYRMPPVRDASAPPVAAKVAAGDLLFDALNDLSADSVDWTVVGPRLYYGAPTIRMPALPTLDTRLHWMEGGASIERDGRVIATEVEVIGAGGARAVYAGPATVNRSLARPARVVRERVTSQAQLDKLARDVWAESQEPQVVVLTDPSLSPDAPVAVQDLIPGRTVNVHHARGDRTVIAQQRLTSVTVTIGAVVDETGWVLAELAVQVELEPALRRLPEEA